MLVSSSDQNWSQANTVFAFLSCPVRCEDIVVNKNFQRLVHIDWEMKLMLETTCFKAPLVATLAFSAI